jgi:hypothetical protein
MVPARGKLEALAAVALKLSDHPPFALSDQVLASLAYSFV